MSYCKRYTASQEAYTLIASGVSEVFIQLEDDGPVFVRVAASLPSASGDEAVKLDREGLMEVLFQGLEASDKVYIRSILDEDNAVIVVAAGDAPT